MPAYRVDEMMGDQVVLSHDVHAPRPKSAAVSGTGRQVTFRTDQEEWIRVVEKVKGRSFSYAYSGTDRRSIIDRELVEAAKELRRFRGQRPMRKRGDC